MKRFFKGAIAMAATAVIATSAISPAMAKDGDPSNNEPNRGRYAAVGDSFAAGVGNPTLKHAGASLRSSAAYPVVLAGADNKVNFLAESGATVADTMVQVGSLTPSVRQVTITVGGNDLGFANVILACFGGLDTTACQGALTNARAASAMLPERLTTLLGEVHQTAPNAHVYVTGYPVLFQAGSYCATYPTANPLLLAQLDQYASNLNDVIESVVSGAIHQGDPAITYVDVEGKFENMGMCNPQGYIFPPVNLQTGQPNPYPVHPNVGGQRAYAEAIADAGFTTSALG